MQPANRRDVDRDAWPDRLQSDDAVPLKDNIRSHIIKAFAAFDLHPAFHREALVLKFSDRDVRRLFDDAEQKPVSYTHLRAHETVLDLVCRLLLAKKKHK